MQNHQEAFVNDIQLQVQFKEMDASDFVYNAVLDELEKLKRIHDRIISCNVVLAAPHRSRQKGKIFHVQIRLHVPGGDIYITSEPEKNHAHEDAYVALRDSFTAARRQLEAFVRSRRGEVKDRQVPHDHGRVVRLFLVEGYGFLVTPDNREIYFHRNSVLNDKFDRLDIGSEVRFSEEMGEKGPQVTSMSVVAP